MAMSSNPDPNLPDPNPGDMRPTDASPGPELLARAARLSDADLTAEVKRLARLEREATVALIAHLAELDRRRLYLAAGCSSLFTYCTRVLHLSEHAAYRRIEAARLARRLPAVLERLAEGTVTLTTVGLLAPYLTPQNHRDLLDRIRYKSRRQVEIVVAELRPQPPVPELVRKLPTPSHAPSLPAAPPGASPPGPAPHGAAPHGAAPPPAAAGWAASEGAAQQGAAQGTETQQGAGSGTHAGPQPGVSRPVPPPVVPLAPQRYKLQLTVGIDTVRKLREAQALLRHQIPDGDLAKVLDRALTLLLRELSRQKFAATERPRPGAGTPAGPRLASRHIPAEVRRTVWARDGGRCAFVGEDGRRCGERSFLEFHHVVPHAMGGASTVDNIQLRCRAHNNYEAERYYGTTGPPAPLPRAHDARSDREPAM